MLNRREPPRPFNIDREIPRISSAKDFVLESPMDAKSLYMNKLTGGWLYEVGIESEGKVLRHFVGLPPLVGTSTLCGVMLLGKEYKQANFYKTCDACIRGMQ